jgi:hypothetical protein
MLFSDIWYEYTQMIKYLTATLAFFAFYSCSQPKIDTGPIKSDPGFSCPASPSSIETECGFSNICRSNNDMEIRLDAEGAPIPYFALYVLMYNGKTWSAAKYEKLGKSLKTDSLKKDILVEHLFDTLKQNNVFTLPDQDNIKIKSTFFVDDGIQYSLTFKAGGKYRRYTFNNPDIYQEKFKDIKEYANYSSIAAAFDSAFERQ